MKMKRLAANLISSFVLVLGCGDRQPGLDPETPTQPNTPALLTNPETSAVVVFDTAFGATRIRAVATIRNATGEAGLVTLRNPCPVVIELYGADAPALPPRWEEWRYRLGCKSFSNPVTLQPQQAVTVSSFPTPIREILGDSIMAGRYWGAAVIMVKEVESGFVRLFLGPVDLGS